MKCDAGIALNLLLPRHQWRRQTWNIGGKLTVFNSRRLPLNVDKAVHRIMKDWDKAGRQGVVKTVPVVDNGVWFIQRALTWDHLHFLFKRNFAWQNWKPGRLPIFLKYKGKLVVWNGTHRTVLAMLFHKRLRVKLLDLDEFMVWRKRNPNRRMWNVSRVVVFGAAKGKRRGHRK